MWLIPLAIAFFFLLPVNEIALTEDGSLYMSQALNIYHGRGLSDLDWSPLYRVRPGLPFMIAFSFWMFGPTPASAFLVTRLFFLLTAPIIFFLGERLFGKWVGLVASLLVLSSVSLNEWSALVHLDHIMPFFMLFFLLLTYMAFDRQSYWLFALAGLSLGVGFLVKEVALLFAPLPFMALVLISAFRTRKNLWGVFLLATLLALMVLPRFVFSYLSTANIEETAVGGSLAAVGNRLSSFDSNVESLTGWRYLQAFIDYYLFHLKPYFRLAPLIVLAWGFTFAVALIKRRPAYVYVCLAGLLLIIIVVVQGTWGYRVRQGLIIFLLSYVVLGNFLVELGKIMWRWFGGWRQVANQPWLAATVGALLPAVVVIYQFGIEQTEMGTMSDFVERYNTVRFIGQENKNWGVRGRLGDKAVLHAGDWIKTYAPPGSDVFIEESLRETIYFYAQGSARFHRIEFPEISWYLEQQSLNALPAKNPETQAYTPLYFWMTKLSANNRYVTQSSLGILIEENFLQQLQEKSIDYIIVTPRANFLALYLLDNPSFEKVAHLGDGAIQIFRVNEVRPNPYKFETHMVDDVVTILTTIRSNTPARYASFERFFYDFFGWDEHDAQLLLDGGFPSASIWQFTDLYDYASLVATRDRETVELVIAQQKQAAIAHPDNPWPLLTLGVLYQTQRRFGEALATFEQSVLVAPDLAEAYLYLAEAYLAADSNSTDQDKALQAYHQALVYGPDSQNVRDAIVAFYLTQDGQSLEYRELLVKVIDAYQKEIGGDPENIIAYRKLAEVYKLLGQVDQEVSIYQQILTRWPKNAEDHFRLGQIYEMQGVSQKAISEYQITIALRKDVAGAYVRLGNLYVAEDQTETAINLYQTATRHNPQNAWPHLELGKLYLEQVNRN